MKTLIYNARILTMNENFDDHQNGWILIEDTTIIACGSSNFDQQNHIIDHKINAGGDLIMPGMVNTHCHMPMVLFRGLGEDVDNRLFKYILPLEKEAITADIVYKGAKFCALEMIMGGVTTTADMYYFEKSVGYGLEKSGMRGIVGQTLADFSSPDHKSFDQAFALVDELRHEFKDSELITPSIAPHAPYSTDVKIMERVANYNANYPEVKIQMHLAEMKSELQWCKENYNCRPVELADKTGILSKGAIMAHCLEINQNEIEILQQRGISVAHNPRSNAKAGRGIAPIENMRKAGIPVGLATDGAMSSNTMDLFSQMAPATMFAKLHGNSRACLPALEVIKMATIEAAKVLGMADIIGSLKAGKKADLVRISLDEPRMNPIYDIYSTLVFTACPKDVKDVMINGQWVMQNRQVLTLDKPQIMSDINQIATDFKARINL